MSRLEPVGKHLARSGVHLGPFRLLACCRDAHEGMHASDSLCRNWLFRRGSSGWDITGTGPRYPLVKLGRSPPDYTSSGLVGARLESLSCRRLEPCLGTWLATGNVTARKKSSPTVLVVMKCTTLSVSGWNSTVVFITSMPVSLLIWRTNGADLFLNNCR